MVSIEKEHPMLTPRSIVELLVAMLEPYKGRVLDSCNGSGGMFVQSERFIKEHQGRVNNISIYGQESNQTTWRLAKINLADTAKKLSLILAAEEHILGLADGRKRYSNRQWA